MVKIGKDDPGITIEGEDYKDVLARKEKRAKEEEAEVERKKEIGTKTKHKKKLKPRERYEADSRRVSKRVHRLSDFEIRKEYGVMAKPFKTLTQNVLYVLFNAGESRMNSRAIADELEKQLPDVSSVLSGIWKKLKGDEIIERHKVGLAYHYCMTEKGLQMGFGPVFEQYFPGPGGVPKEKRQPKQVEPAPVEDPKLKGAYKHLKELTRMILERVEALEGNGKDSPPISVLDARITDFGNDLRRMALTVGKVMAFQDDFEDKIKAAVPMDRTPGKFDLNVNVRFLLR
jgi:hypothetical protein